MALLYENLRQLITMVDELRDVGLQNYISLPRIAAIGTQSSGKSSAIESIVGLDFLPRGGGVVTRRPLELRLVHLNTQDFAGDQAWAVFDKIGDKKFTDFNEVRAEIERQTDEVAGKNKGIINDPIVLTIYATGAPDLTLIDLPGITRVPVKGSDQTEDVEKLTRDMTLHYIKDPRTIILAVLPANQDMSVSDALQMARQVDPQGLRSIGVVTKIDIMDQGTDAVRMLKGEDVPLRLGYVGVKMRSQQDINSSKAVKSAIQDEKDWFENHRVYGKLPPGLVGTPVLIDKLTQVLFRHIRRFLPDIKKEINEKRRGVQDRLDELGQGVPVDEAERVQVMWTMVTDYCEMFKNTIRGKYDRKLQKYMANVHSDASMSGGARVRSIMNDFLLDHIEASITADMTDDDIDRAIRMHEGDSLPGFPSPDTFEFLALPHLQKIAIPAVECVHNVGGALDLLAQRMAQAVFRRFPALAQCALEMTQNIIQREKDAARIVVEQQVACHVGYLFTNDPIYLTEHGSMEPMYKQAQQAQRAQPVEEEKKEPNAFEKAGQQVKDKSQAAFTAVKGYVGQNQPAQRRQQRYSGPFVLEIRKRLDSYFFITVRNARDSVPKAIGYYLVRAVLDKLQFELLNELNKGDKIQELLGEPVHIMEERKQLKAQLDVLSRASGVLSRDPTLAAIAFEAEEEEEELAQRAAPAPKPAVSQQAAAPAPVRQAPAPAPAPQRPQATSSPSPSPAPGRAAGGQPAPLFGGPAPTKAGLFDEAPSRAAKAPGLPAKSNPLFD